MTDHFPRHRRSPARSTGGEEEASPSPDDLPACLSCRRRKSRCSRERPSCAQCIKIGAECQYIVKQKPGIRAGAVDSLSRRLEVLEQILLGSSGNTKAKLLALFDCDIEGLSRSNGNLHSALPSSTEWQRSLNHGDSSGHAMDDSPANNNGASQPDEEHRRKRQRADDVDQHQYLDAADDDDSRMPPLPSLPFLEAVVEAHFQTVPYITGYRFSTRQDFGPSGRTRTRGKDLLFSSMRCCPWQSIMMHAMESLSIETTQALIIVAFDYMGSGQVTKAWPIIGSLTRLVDYLQLTVEPDEDSPKQPLLRPLTILDKPQDWTESEERRRLFWNVFLLDRICSVTSGWHTSLTSDDVRRRLPCGGAMWARSEPVSTPYFGIWDKSTAKIGNSISNVPTIYLSPKAVDHPSPGSNGDVDISKLGAFAYCIEVTENLSHVTSFFLQQGVDFEDRDEVKNWLTRFKELDLRLVHWKMFLPRQWQDSNVSRDILVIKMDPNLTLAHISHNTSMILLHQHIAYPPRRWKGVVKLPSSCSAETCHLAAVETASIVQKYLRYMGGIVNGQFAFCAFVAAKVLLVHWRASENHTLAPEFSILLQSLKDMSSKWRGYYKFESDFSGAPSGYERENFIDLAEKYAAQLQEWHSHCIDDTAFPAADIAEILCEASLQDFVENPAQNISVISPSYTDYRNPSSSGRTDQQYASRFETYQRVGVPSPTRGSDLLAGYPSHRSPVHRRLSTAYEIHGTRLSGDEISPRSQPGTVQSPVTMSAPNTNMMNVNSSSSAALMNGINTGNNSNSNNFTHGRPNIAEEDELTAMSHMLLGNQFLEMDRVITLQGTDFFSFDAAGRAGLSG